MATRMQLLRTLAMLGVFIPAPVQAVQLHNAASAGDLEQVSQLIAEGVDVNARIDDGWTPLIIASQFGHEEIVRLLLANGADVNAKPDNGQTALIVASVHGLVEIADLLLAAGADVDAREESGTTPLMVASYAGHTELVDLLLAAGADVNLPVLLVNAIQALPEELQRDPSVLVKLLVLADSTIQGEDQFLAQGWTVRDGLTGRVGIVGYLFSGDAHTYVIGTADTGAMEAEAAQGDFAFARGLGGMLSGNSQFDLNVRGAVHMCTLLFMDGELVSLEWSS